MPCTFVCVITPGTLDFLHHADFAFDVIAVTQPMVEAESDRDVRMMQMDGDDTKEKGPTHDMIERIMHTLRFSAVRTTHKPSS